MIKIPPKASDVQVKIIVSNIAVLEDAVNQWLTNAPADIAIHEILYQHFAAAADSSGKASVIILFGKR
ncbi:MAG: hypothetical protein KKF26_02635 [Chloroflexi bacterium]|nr:hypothetical protein [Chloroflexota bacterium]